MLQHLHRRVLRDVLGEHRRGYALLTRAALRDAPVCRGNQMRAIYRSWHDDVSKSSTCFGKKSGEPLSEYSSACAAEDAARLATARNGLLLEPYQCSECGYFHLAPRDRATPSMPCLCLSSAGTPKALFFSRGDAERRAAILLRERGKRLNVHRCEYGLGWHLTGRWVSEY